MADDRITVATCRKFMTRVEPRILLLKKVSRQLTVTVSIN